MKLMIDIPNEWFDQMVREEFTNYPSKVDELCAIIQHSVAIPSAEPKCESCELNRQRFMQTLDVAFELGKMSAEPYKGMTNGEVIKAMFPDIPRTLEWHIQNVTDNDWWNSPYSEEGSD